MTTSSRMSPAELRASIGLAGIFGLRMLGMFIILPVFALHAHALAGGDNLTLVGIALGAYGLTQALLQIPFGSLSDRWGRKRTIYVGLAIFAVGSFVAALAQDIYVVILGRVIQGAGAVSAAVIALTADLTREAQRTKAMAIIGMTIGGTFALSMVAGPLLGNAVGVPGIFALTGVLALLAIGVVRWIVPQPEGHDTAAVERSNLTMLLRDPELARLDYGIFVLHAVLMALWVVVPFSLLRSGLPAGNHWQVYLPVMVGSIALMVPPMLASERRNLQKAAFVASVAVLLAAQGMLALGSGSLWATGLALTVFFAAFNFLEASLPSMVSKAAPSAAKGTALGVYSSVQFLGAFAGAAAAGYCSQHFGPTSVYLLCGALTLSWLAVAAKMRLAGRVRIYPVPRLDECSAQGLSRRLAGLPGVREATVPAGAGVARLTVDSARFDEQHVLRLLSGGEVR